jgi:hypothetical protein
MNETEKVDPIGIPVIGQQLVQGHVIGRVRRASSRGGLIEVEMADHAILAVAA